MGTGNNILCKYLPLLFHIDRWGWRFDQNLVPFKMDYFFYTFFNKVINIKQKRLKVTSWVNFFPCRNMLNVINYSLKSRTDRIIWVIDISTSLSMIVNHLLVGLKCWIDVLWRYTWERTMLLMMMLKNR